MFCACVCVYVYFFIINTTRTKGSISRKGRNANERMDASIKRALEPPLFTVGQFICCTAFKFQGIFIATYSSAYLNISVKELQSFSVLVCVYMPDGVK